MDDVFQSKEMVPENLRKQLGVAVRSVQWSYAIFWSLSTSEQGTLEWADGYYNGDIKTRKSIPAMELKADEIGLQRSEQLRELYKSLLEVETDQESKRPCASLSPDDLSDAEWYYLVCMSFVFKPDEGLPGRALANKQTIWLCNAQYADSKVFTRFLLAKSASIQTVVCFPHLKGVIELGVNELVEEDDSLIQHIKASLLDFSKPVCLEKSLAAPYNADNDDHEETRYVTPENLCTAKGDLECEHGGVERLQENMHEGLSMDSPDDYSNACKHNQQTADSFMLEGVNREASHVQSWDFMDDEFSNGVQDSMNSSDCMSQAFLNQEEAFSSTKRKNIRQLQLDKLHKGNHKIEAADYHYHRILSVILRSSNQLSENSCYSTKYQSSFVNWKEGAVVGYNPIVQQNMLKKILLDVPLMHDASSRRPHCENGGTNSVAKSKSYKKCRGHDLSEQQKEDAKLLLLSSMVPSICKTDKASILTDTIRYLMDLEARVEELESYMDWLDYEVRPRRNYMDLVDQASDNYESKKIDNGQRPVINKRKACDIDESDEYSELREVVYKDGVSLELKVSMKGKEVLIDMKCPAREYILVDIMAVINSLNLDVHSVQSCTLDGLLTLALKSKFRGAAAAPIVMIKEELWKVARIS